MIQLLDVTESYFHGPTWRCWGHPQTMPPGLDQQEPISCMCRGASTHQSSLQKERGRSACVEYNNLHIKKSADIRFPVIFATLWAVGFWMESVLKQCILLGTQFSSLEHMCSIKSAGLRLCSSSMSRLSVIGSDFESTSSLWSASAGSQICKGSSLCGFPAPSCRIGIQHQFTLDSAELSLSLARQERHPNPDWQIPSADQIYPP